MKSVKIFSTFEEYEILKIIDSVKPANYKAGSTIIKEVISIFKLQGEIGNTFYILKAGEAFATKVLKANGAPEKVKDYNSGEYFGELALINNTPRAASILAKVKSIFTYRLIVNA